MLWVKIASILSRHDIIIRDCNADIHVYRLTRRSSPTASRKAVAIFMVRAVARGGLAAGRWAATVHAHTPLCQSVSGECSAIDMGGGCPALSNVGSIGGGLCVGHCQMFVQCRWVRANVRWSTLVAHAIRG